MDGESCYDVIVLGAGVQGSSTSYYLTQKAGIKKVLLLEQFSALHIRGSSHGNSRITRRAYDQAYYVKMMNEAFKMWSDLEQESNSKLYIRTGILVFGNDAAVDEVSDSLKTHGIVHETFSGSEANIRYSNQLSLPHDFNCLFEEDGGILMAAKAVAMYQKLFVSSGGELKDEHPVTEVIPGDVVVVKTPKATFRTKRLVITAGAWAPALLKTLGVDLPFKILRTEVIYWKVESPKKEVFAPDKFPVFITRDNSGGGMYFYGIPVHEYPGLVKICYHSGQEITPDDRDADPFASTTEITSNFIKKYFKGVATTPSIVEPCMYTDSPTGDPVLDRHPDHPNIVIGAGFTGHGFKLSPVIGKVLSELILDLPLSYDLSPFKLSRYQQ